MKKNTKDKGAKSLGEAMAKGHSIVWAKDRESPYQVTYTKGNEKDTIILLLDFLEPKQMDNLLMDVATQIGLQLIPIETFKEVKEVKKVAWDELNKTSDYYFYLVFFNDSDNYISEEYHRERNETFEQAAERVCIKFGWDKIKPGNKTNKTNKTNKIKL